MIDKAGAEDQAPGTAKRELTEIAEETKEADSEAVHDADVDKDKDLMKVEPPHEAK